ncbi:protein expanded-like [Argopecten irradians]|uniref:protein expanded-like n=1 Tax=Argopecten irradians TaxID=31199 RepID=UPI0037132E11
MSSLSLAHASCKKRKVVNVILLDKEHIQVYVDVKSKFQDVFNQVTGYLNLRETEYFGLAQKKDSEYQFVTLEEKIHKQAPKSWKSGHGEGFDAAGQPVFTVYFKVQFYVDQVVLLRENVTRHLYYLQLRENILQYDHVCTEERCFQIASFALQADFGNYHPERHGDTYFDPREYFPAWMIQQRGSSYIQKNTPLIHQDLQNLTKSEAKLRFIKEASLSPAAHNLHFYRLRKRKTDKRWNAWLGICARGIEIYEELEGHLKDLISTFLWPDIGKLYFDKKKFEVRWVGNPAGRKFTYYTDCDNTSKYLLYICRTTHMFQMAIQSKLMEIQHLDAEDKKRYNEAYIYSDTKDYMANGGSFRGSLSPASKSSNPRYSVISDASSNTTSGIASDKMTISFEGEDDPTREILIDCPPRPLSRLTPPSQSRSKIFNGTTYYKSNKNGSPVLEMRPTELYKSASVGRPGGTKSGDHSPSVARPKQLSPSSKHGTDKRSPGSSSVGAFPLTGHQSDLDYPPTGGEVYRRMSQQHVHPTQYSPRTVPLYMAHAHTPTSSGGAPPPERISYSQPVSRSTSRADSFKGTLGQLQIHTSDSQLPHLQLDSGLSDQMMDMFSGNVNLAASYQQSGLEAGHPHRVQRSNLIPPNLDSGAAYIEDSEMTLQAHELFAPPPMFADSSSRGNLSDVSPVLETSAMLNLGPDHQVSQPLAEPRRYMETNLDDDLESSPDTSLSESLPQQRSGNKKKETLHPELKEKILGQNMVAIPLMMALCKDKSLMSTNSGSYDASTLQSTDSRISLRLSNDLDPRRLSSCYPSSTMVSSHSNRPFSWHSESFDLDAQLALNGYPAASVDNHRSVPQNIGDLTEIANASWTHAISHGIPFRQGVLHRYSPELIATQHMIPPKISSGRGHNSNDRNISQKPLKETIGIA